MSEFRRRLMMQRLNDGGDPLVKTMDAINNLPGEKSFLYKFDNDPLVYVLTTNKFSDTNHVLHIFDLNGNELASLSHSSKRHFGIVINKYICIYQGTSNSNVPMDVFQFDGVSTINKIATQTTDNWPGQRSVFAYKDNADNIHFCGYCNNARNAMWDYNVQTETYSRIESTYDKWISWYNYDGSYFRGLIHSPTSGQLQVVSYLKNTSTTGVFNGSYSPSISGKYAAYFLPLLFYDGSYEDLQYEMFVGASYWSIEYFNNVLGLEQTEPTSLSIGNITIPYTNINNPYSLIERCGVSFVDNGHLCIYTPNISTKQVEKIVL